MICYLWGGAKGEKSTSKGTLKTGTEESIGNASNDEPQPYSDARKKDDEGVSKESGIDDQEKAKTDREKKRSIVPNVFIFSALLDGLILEDRILAAEKFFKKLIKQKLCEPTVVTYNTMIKGLCKVGNNVIAIQFLRLMDERGCKPDAYTYNNIIDSLCKDKMIDDAFKLFKEMVLKKGISPNVITYNCLIDGLCSLGRWEEASKMLQEMLDVGISPNVRTSNILVDAFCKEGKVEEAENVIDVMIKRGIVPNIVTYSTLIDGYCLRGEMIKVETIFDSMVLRDVVPNVVTYNSLLNGYCKTLKIDEAMLLFQEMNEKGLKPNVVTCSTMIQGLFRVGRCGDARKLLDEMHAKEEAHSLFHSMGECKLNSDVVVYNILIDGANKCGKVETARELLQDLTNKGLHPNARTYSVIISGLCREGLVGDAKVLFLKIEKSGCLRDNITYRVLLQGYLKNNHYDDVEMLLHEMGERCYSLDATTLSMLLDQIAGVSINSIIKSRDAIFDENRFSSIPRPKDIIPNSDESQRGDHSDDVPKAIHDEIGSIMGNDMWALSDLPPGYKPSGIDNFKARLVIQGFRRKEGIDYFDTPALIAHTTTIRLLLALAAIHNLVIHQMDVKIAFLNGDLMKKTDQNQVDKTKKFLSSRFSMKDMGELDVILDIKINRENKGIVITLSHHIEKILKKFNRKDCSPLEYSRAIGCLMYAMTSTRPDIAYVVGRLSRFTSNTSRQHWKAITRVFKYLRGTKDYGLSYVGYPSVLEGAISWAFKKQTCITGSTMEYEFVALVAAGKEAEWLRNLINEIPIWPKPIALISIRCDSASRWPKHIVSKSRITLKWGEGGFVGDFSVINDHLDVARGHGGNGGGDDRSPSHQGTQKPNLGGRKAGRLHTRQETRNLRLKKITDVHGLVPIRFEWNDKETLMPLGDHAAHWANYLGELVRELPMHCPFCRQVPAEQKAGVLAKIETQFDLKLHMESERLTMWRASDADIPRRFLRQIKMRRLASGMIPRIFPGVLKITKTRERARSYADRDPDYLLPFEIRW
nr:tetratricopeptide-like helical domain-containing protein [Tanacetum cinerariifolium]